MKNRTHALVRYSTLLGSLVLLIALSATNFHNALLSLALFTVVGISGVFLASSRKLGIIISISLCIPWLTLAWLNQNVFDNSIIGIIALIFAMLFLGFTTFLVLRHLVYARKVTTDLLFGACAAYLLLGIIWAFIYTLSLKLNPQCISFPESSQGDWATLVYFSFTTLTTLGYGDILPVTGPIRTLAVFEAIVGVLYSAILIARLMGIYISTVLETKRNR